MIKLPLGKHPQTSRFSMILDMNGHNINNPYEMLKSQPFIDAGQLIGLKDSNMYPNYPNDISEPPEAIAPMIKGCIFLNKLVEKAGNLKHTERMVLLYTLGHCKDAGGAYIHKVMSLCGNYNPRVTEKFIQRLEPGHKAIRCSRIQEWMKDYMPGVSCQCQNTKRKNPSPLDLLSKLEKKKEKAQGADQSWKSKTDDLFDFNKDMEE